MLDPVCGVVPVLQSCLRERFVDAARRARCNRDERWRELGQFPEIYRWEIAGGRGSGAVIAGNTGLRITPEGLPRTAGD